MPPSGFLKSHRAYIAMFLLNLAIVVGVVYLLRRDTPHPVLVTFPPVHPTDANSAASKARPAQITVVVSGQVQKPGTYALTVPARVADALQQAGGLRADADVSGLSLTQPLRDGDQITVPLRGSAPPVANSGGTSLPVTSNLASQKAAAPSLLTTPAATARVNLNTATLDQLNALPGIGPALAQRILDYRTEHGAFQTIDQIKDVRGIGDVIFGQIKELITVQ